MATDPQATVVPLSLTTVMLVAGRTTGAVPALQSQLPVLSVPHEAKQKQSQGRAAGGGQERGTRVSGAVWTAPRSRRRQGSTVGGLNCSPHRDARSCGHSPPDFCPLKRVEGEKERVNDATPLDKF